MKLEGVGVTPRKAAGKVHRHTTEELSYNIDSDKPSEEEEERFESAVERAEEQLEKTAEQTEEETSKEEADIFRAQIQFLQDPQIKSNVVENISKGLTAEKSVEKGFEEPIEKLASQDGRMGERADDLRDIRDRLIRILSGKDNKQLSNIPEGSVVVADNLKPSDTSQMDRSNVEALVTAKGSKTSHVAILAKSMQIPAVVGTGSVDQLEEGDKVLVNGKDSEVVINPSSEELENIPEDTQIEAIKEQVSTKDGKNIEVAANVANPEEVKKASEHGSDGIGLYRTEFMFLERKKSPSEEEHFENYVTALEQFPDNRVIVRTMDIGGDKPVPYLDTGESDNPFLGVRGVRLAFEEGEQLFDTQIKALLRAAATEHGDNLAVMFPMISSMEEFEELLEKIEYIEGVLEGEGKDYERPELGLMIETPSAVQIAGELAEKADFLSIGTNDLTQYTMAASRTSSKVSELQDPLYPSVLRSIKQTVEKGHENDAWVGMCGEMAGNSELTELLIGLGLDELSMSPGRVPRVKNKIKEVSEADSQVKAGNIIEASRRSDIKDLL